MKENTQKKPSLFLMLLLVCVGSIGAVLYTPAMPAIASFFNISAKKAELSMTIYLLGYALGQLPYGPISNHFGRKKTLYFGLCLAAMGSLLSVFSSYLVSYEIFLLSRLTYSLGATAGLHVIYTIVGDLYRPPKSIQIASYLTLTFALGPSISTTIGGALTDAFGWISCFYFLFFYLIFLLILSTTLPETGVREKSNFKKILIDYSTHFKEPVILMTGVIIGLAICFNYTFSTLAPFIVIKQMGISPSFYGFYNLLPSTALVIGAFFASYIAKKEILKPMQSVFLSIILTLVGSLMLLMSSFSSMTHVLLLFIPYACALFPQPILETNTLCLALYHNKNKAMTSAVMNCVSILLCALFSLSGRIVKEPSSFDLSIIFIGLTFLIFFCYLKLRKNNI